MNKIHLLLSVIFLYSGCTKNNQNAPSSFAYLSVNQTYSNSSATYQSYDINNDGQVDWGFNFGVDGLSTYNQSSPTTNITTYITGITWDAAEILPIGYVVSSSKQFSNHSNITIVGRTVYTEIDANYNVLGTGDFYIGFKSQNPTFTNSFYGWARLNLSSDGKTLIVKDMAINGVNGGSINVGQH